MAIASRLMHPVLGVSWAIGAVLLGGALGPVGCGGTFDASETTETVQSEIAGRYDWLQFNGDPQHSGNDTSETGLGHGNVASLARKFRSTLPSVADGAPVYLA